MRSPHDIWLIRYTRIFPRWRGLLVGHAVQRMAPFANTALWGTYA